MSAGAMPRTEAAPATARAFAALWRPAVESRVVDGPGERVEPVDLQRSCRRGRWRSTRPSSAVAGPAAVEKRSAIARA